MARTIRKAVADGLRVGQADMEGSITAGWLAANSVTRNILTPIKFGTLMVTMPSEINAGSVGNTMADITGIVTSDNFTVSQVAGSIDAGAVPVHAICETDGILTIEFANVSNVISSAVASFELMWVRHIE